MSGCRCFSCDDPQIDDLGWHEIATIVFRSWSIRQRELSAIVAHYVADELFWMYCRTHPPQPMTYILGNGESSQMKVTLGSVSSWTNKGSIFISVLNKRVNKFHHPCSLLLVKRANDITKLLDYGNMFLTNLRHIAASSNLFLFNVTVEGDNHFFEDIVNIVDDQLNVRCSMRLRADCWTTVVARLDATVGVIVVLATSSDRSVPELWLHYCNGHDRDPVWKQVPVTVDGWSTKIYFLHNQVVGQITNDNKLLAVITNSSYEPIETYTCDLTKRTCDPQCACRQLQPFRCRYFHEIFMTDHQTVLFLLSGDNGGSIWCKLKIGSPTFIHGPLRSWPPPSSWRPPLNWSFTLDRETSQINIIGNTIVECIPPDNLLLVTNLDTLCTA
jgi:hypothetical protein